MIKRLTSRTTIIAIIALLLIVLQVLALLPNLTTPLVRMELSTRDLLMRFRPTPHLSGQVIIVEIDNNSFSWTGYRWPWPRADLAKIVNWLNQAGAKVVGLDMFLSEPDSDSQGDLANASAEIANTFRSEQISGG